MVGPGVSPGGHPKRHRTGLVGQGGIEPSDLTLIKRALYR
jgi:hypothetical protein